MGGDASAGEVGGEEALRYVGVPQSISCQPVEWAGAAIALQLNGTPARRYFVTILVNGQQHRLDGHVRVELSEEMMRVLMRYWQRLPCLVAVEADADYVASLIHVTPVKTGIPRLDR